MTDSPASERRLSSREIACFPAYVEHDAASKKEVALIADVAPGGARLLVAGGRGFTMSEVVRLELHIEPGTIRPAKGRVVRIEALPKERVSVWTHQVGIEFEAAIQLTPDEQQTIRDQCDRLGVRR